MTATIERPFDFRQGATPLLISIPHPGVLLPPGMDNRLTEKARALPDTDWHMPRLYDFALDMGAGIIAARYSRYAIDLNRPPDDAPLYQTATTGLFPDVMFDGSPVFAAGALPDERAKAECLARIWRPYHAQLDAELARLRELFGHAVLLDAHSILGFVPRLFDGELPDFNLGSNDGSSCDENLERLALDACHADNYRTILNGRFKGGYITRCFGRPREGYHAIQLELAQRTYMIEAPPFGFDEGRANQVRPVLRRLVRTLIEWRP